MTAPRDRQFSFKVPRVTILAVCGLSVLACGAARAATAAVAPTVPERRGDAAPHKLDLTGHQRIGKASVYDLKNRKMADGTRMNPQSNNAASKTLPLGTKAKVTNLGTGKTAVVTIRDRGPYVPGRIVDLSPATASKIGLSQRQGVATVAVAPITVPLPDGDLKTGAAAAAEIHRPL
jgi:rare lipoprotein A